MFDHVRTRLRKLQDAPTAALEAAAPKVLARLRSDATTKRGNVPSFGKMGDVPIAVDVRASALNVRGPDWVMRKADELGQPQAWGEIAADEFRRIVGTK